MKVAEAVVAGSKRTASDGGSASGRTARCAARAPRLARVCLPCTYFGVGSPAVLPPPAAADEGRALKMQRVPTSEGSAAPRMDRLPRYISLTTHPGRAGIRPITVRVRFRRSASCPSPN